MTRRSFLQVATTVPFAPYFFSSVKPLHAAALGDRLRVACIGLGAQGRGDAQTFNSIADVVALCDVDADYGLAKAKADRGINRLDPDTYTDYRKVLDQRDIDIVSIATVDHWHVKIAIEALQAGKHVFCQKPLTLTVDEGRLIRQAVRKYPKQVFQVGAQQRSDKGRFALAALMVRKGVLGKINRMTVCLDGGGIGGPFATEDPPESLDWYTWLGQCRETQYIKERCHRTFRYWYDYAAGTLTDWGAHHLDFVHWALELEKPGNGPTRITPVKVDFPVPFKDGEPTVENCYNTPINFEIVCAFPNDVEVVVSSKTADGNGILIEGTKGRVNVNRGRITGKPVEEKWYEGLITEEDFQHLAHGLSFVAADEVPPGFRNHDFRLSDIVHKVNMIHCVREGGTPLCEPISQVQTMNTCHLCAIAARLGREIHWDPKSEKIIGDDKAASYLAREQRKGFEIPEVR